MAKGLESLGEKYHTDAESYDESLKVIKETSHMPIN